MILIAMTSLGKFLGRVAGSDGATFRQTRRAVV
jgi:hypothetical protein